MAFTQVRLSGQWPGSTGQVTVTPTRTMVNSGVTVPDSPVIYPLDSSGSVAFNVAATDDVGTTPQEVEYEIVIVRGSVSTTYLTPVSASLAVSGGDLTKLPFVTPPADPTTPLAGSTAAWIASLVAPAGPAGPAGPPGAPGSGGTTWTPTAVLTAPQANPVSAQMVVCNPAGGAFSQVLPAATVGTTFGIANVATTGNNVVTPTPAGTDVILPTGSTPTVAPGECLTFECFVTGLWSLT